MRNQIQQSRIKGMTRIAGRGLLAATFALSVVVNAGVVQNPQPAQQSKNQQTPPLNKTRRPERTGVLTIEELEALRVAQIPQVLKTGYPHIEIDLHRQVLFVVDVAGVPLRILPISSGSGEFFTEGGVTRQAVTPTGRFKVYRKIEGWRKSPLGLLYYPNYIYGGIAIHGNPSVPAHPASHGCIRIPMFASREFSEIATIGMVVIVYDSDPLAEADAAEPE